MNTSTKVKILGATTMGLSLLTGVNATAIIANDTFEGLPSLGSNIGGFLTNLVPGVIAFVFALAVIGGVVAIFMAIAKKIGGSVGGRMR